MDTPYGNYQENKFILPAPVLDFFVTLFVCLAIGIIIYWQIARPHKVSGLSMYPTFNNGDYIITDEIIYKFTTPQRGQVIVFEDPKDHSEDFIKRVIGLPGDIIELQNGHVYVNGKQLSESYLNLSIQTNGEAFLQEGESITVPPNHYFVLGDNRPNSSDSRDFGFVDKSEVIGQAFFRYWPSSSIGLIPTARY